ncbi:MAG: cryptochrome/photolyase family protein [Cytophagales bacterium]|nr:cryptochrome/photolyase family protein [Armatimonadota bacterium]
MSAALVSVWILGDQLSPRMSALGGLNPKECIVVMVESVARGRQLRYHKQKLTLVWSAMRHFADELRELGYEVDYYRTQPDYETALCAHLERFRPARLRMMQASEWGVTERLCAAVEALGVPAEVTPQNLFASTHEAFRSLVGTRSSVVMEEFYQAQRRRLDLLMEGGKPVGGRFNFDTENREKPPKGHLFPSAPEFPPDAITLEVIEAVERCLPDGFGSLDTFCWPVTRADAERARDDFLENRLDLFGPYEDAFVTGERVLYHSLQSALMNLGLLDPLESCRLAEARYRDGRARLNSVEGFIRQLIGWREFVFQWYWWKMPGLADANHFSHDIPLPRFYTDGETDMRCVRESVLTLQRYGTTHHIQRLMVLGNFSLIAGVRPQELRDWFWLAYADAYDWVVTPNVVAMSQHADGGQANGGLGTKPYVSSANYINTMSDYCKTCAYNPKKAVGEDACPFNALYWDFLARNEPELSGNPRMNKILFNLYRKEPGDLAEIRARAADLQARLRAGQSLRTI